MSMKETREVATGVAATLSLSEQAVRYVELWHWDVVPGAWIEVRGGYPACSCGTPGCGAPGAHPVSRDWAARATGSGTVARRLWSEHPWAAILLPTGRTFDVLEVPEAAGCLALARMERTGTMLGPVCGTPFGRMMFFVLPGGAAKAPALLRRMGWSMGAIDLVPRGEGDLVPAPPTRMGTRGWVQWAREPTVANSWLPDSEELLPALAYACGQAREEQPQ